jgi:hypothetical protein
MERSDFPLHLLLFRARIERWIFARYRLRHFNLGRTFACAGDGRVSNDWIKSRVVGTSASRNPEFYKNAFLRAT